MGARKVRNVGFDHMTVVVTDLDEARRFFGLLGFAERGATVHQEVQLLRFHQPPPAADEGAGTLTRVGFNHVCFRVDDLDAMLAHLAPHGITPRNEVMDFHDRRLVFLDGPGIVVELAQWLQGPGAHDAS
jgi:catechol 2,3-dioxygenase-like lactoylglutathione lyase family enzyme